MDRRTKDYHNWDAREDEAYRRWLESKHASSVDYDRLDQKRQESVGNAAITMRNTSTKTVGIICERRRFRPPPPPF